MLFLVDVQNLFYSLRDLYGMDARLDFLKLREIACRRSKCTSCRSRVYLTTLREDLNSLSDFLICNGFDVKTKQMEFRHKGDVDTQIVVDTMNDLKDFDIFVIGSGDSDYVPLVENLKENKKEVGVISFSNTSSKRLEQSADWIIHLDDRINMQDKNG